MRNVSAEFLAEVARSHRVAVEAWVHPADGSDPVVVPVTEGSVTLDATAEVRGRCDITVQHAEWIPTDALDRLAPFGSELELRRGVVLPDGSTETVGLGRFGIEDAEITDEGQGASVRVAALDRAERVSKAMFTDTYQVPNGKPFTEAILDLVLEVFPDCPYQPDFLDASSMTSTLLPTAQAGESRWQAAQDMAFALGMTLFFDGDGVLTLRRYAEQGPVLDLVEGEGGVLLSVSRSWSRTEAFNQAIVTGESGEGSDVYRGVATDLNADSPTYFYGPFGRVPKPFQFPQIESDAMAQDCANTLLAKNLGVPSTVSFGMVPNPALEPEDTIRITRGAVGVDENHIVDSLTVGLGQSEVMSGVTRERISF